MNGEYMTRKGYEKLLTKDKELKRKLKEIGEMTRDAAGKNGDWNDNPDYELHINEVNRLNYQISKVRDQIKNAKIINENELEKQITKDINKVIIGSYVTLEIEGEVEKYFIGGEVDSNPFQGVISYKAPLAEAIMGCKVGDEKVVVIKNSSFRIKVLNVESSDEKGNKM